MFFHLFIVFAFNGQHLKVHIVDI